MAKTTRPKAPAKPKRQGQGQVRQAKAGEAPKAKQAAAGPPRQPGVERRKNHPPAGQERPHAASS